MLKPYNVIKPNQLDNAVSIVYGMSVSIWYKYKIFNIFIVLMYK